MIKHISFDLWLTLIKSHPEFKEKRALFLRKEFNPRDYSVKQIMEIVQKTDKISDRLNEITGKKVPTRQMYRRILQDLGNGPLALNDELLNQINLKVCDLFKEFPPQFVNAFIKPMLHSLKEEGYTLNLSSNTGFIEGNTITGTLKQLKIAEYFVFCIFSDEIEASKPSSAFFDKVYEKVTVRKEEILHVGDNYKADFEGALTYGFRALHITNQNYTIDDIRRHL